MKLSIIIPYYNMGKWLGPCLDSLLNQGLASEDYEIIVVDDGSTESIEELQRYVDNYPTIKYLWQENGRQGAARNHGIQQAQGDYVMFCDADDFVHPQTLGPLVDLAEAQGLDVLFYELIKTDHRDFIQTEDHATVSYYASGRAYLESLEVLPPTYPWLFLLKREVIMNYGLQFRSLVSLEDEYFYLEMIKVVGKVGTTSQLVYYYFNNPESITHLEGKRQKAEAYVSNFYLLILKLTEDSEAAPSVSYLYLQRRDFRVFVLLHHIMRYCDLKTTFHYVPKLRAIGALPMKTNVLNGTRLQYLRNLMNHRLLWYALVTLFHALPPSVRYRF